MSEFSSSVMSELGTYGFGGFQDNARELARLNFQAEVAWPIERAALMRHGLKPHSKVLDVACGTGTITRQIATLLQSGSIIGIDLNDSLLHEAQAKVISPAAKNLSFQKGDVYRLDQTAQFNFAYARFLFQHLARPVAALRSIRSALQSGGRVLIVDVDDRDLTCAPSNDEFTQFLAEAARYQSNGGGNRMIGRALPDLLQQAGFRDIRHETIRFDSDQLGLDQFLELTTSFKLEQFPIEDREKADRWLSNIIDQLQRRRARLQIDIHCVSGAR